MVNSLLGHVWIFPETDEESFQKFYGEWLDQMGIFKKIILVEV